MKNLFKNEKGQTVVIILLIMVVGLTIGLSIVNRSLSDIKISQETEQSQRAFSAAEAGLEKAILNINSGQAVSGSINNVNYTVEKKLYGGTVNTPNGYVLTGKSAVKQDDVAQINLEPVSGSPNVQQLKIFWAKRGTSEMNATGPCDAPKVASLEISQINYNSALTPAYTIYKFAYKACSDNGNDFDTNITTEPLGSDYAYSKVIDIQNYQYAKILRIRPLFNDTSLKIQVQGTGTLPDQEILLTSKGEANGKVRAIEWRQPIKPALPAIFDYVLFNGSSNPLSK